MSTDPAPSQALRTVQLIADAVQKAGRLHCAGEVLILDRRNLEDAIQSALLAVGDQPAAPQDMNDRESFREQLCRVQEMSRDTGESWDLSVNDQAALRAVLEDRQRMAVRLNALSAVGPPEAPEPPAWQPIETAPRDGTEILLTDGHYKRTGWWAKRVGVWSMDAAVQLAMPTHWTLLPRAAGAPQGERPK